MSKIDHKGAEEARNQLPDLLEAAVRGRSTIITRRGKAVAALVPLEELSSQGRQKNALRLIGSGKGLWGRNPGAAVTRLRDEWE
ncbi:MAG: type II toxin-antitoxin system Phd/YefM family antitoxin [Hyphomonadaceae bacterium]|nr:type II toxin-antitoxin system Phd/YefM family antitoxin [Hyphomonadaceae bacterium]